MNEQTNEYSKQIQMTNLNKRTNKTNECKVMSKMIHEHFQSIMNKDHLQI